MAMQLKSEMVRESPTLAIKYGPSMSPAPTRLANVSCGALELVSTVGFGC